MSTDASTGFTPTPIEIARKAKAATCFGGPAVTPAESKILGDAYVELCNKIIEQADEEARVDRLEQQEDDDIDEAWLITEWGYQMGERGFPVKLLDDIAVNYHMDGKVVLVDRTDRHGVVLPGFYAKKVQMNRLMYLLSEGCL